MRGPLRILAADDEESMRAFYRALLPRLGHEVVVAENGRQVVEQSRVTSPDLAILDIRMPELDGLDAAREINFRKPIPIIVVSGYHSADLLERARVESILAYLIKPIQQADLEVAIELAMARFEFARALRQETADLRQALEDRKVVDRAKDILMRRLSVGEQKAFRCLQQLARDRNQKTIDAARSILAVDGVFQMMERAVRSK
jgi:AmiR/NasT family two-component response regulator